VRLETHLELDNTYLFFSFNSLQNNVLSGLTGTELREAYFDYSSDNWDLRIGRQIIIWGKADGVQITDIISPYDMTEFLARDYDDIRTPVDAFKFRLLGDNMDMELVWLPQFHPGKMPGQNNPWRTESADYSSYAQTTYLEGEEPEQKLTNSEIGGKLSIYLPGIDISFSSFYTWSDFPVSNGRVSGDTLIIEPEYYRLTFIGAEFSKSLDDFVLRGETAFFQGGRFSVENGNKPSLKKNYIKALIGADWYPGDEWTVIIQLSDQFIIDHEEYLADDNHDWLATLNVSKKLMRSTLTLSSFSYIGLNEKDLFNRSSVDYALSDEFHLLLGVDCFLGNEGTFGQFQDNSEVWIKAKYSF
jgi:hypothetical protein